MQEQLIEYKGIVCDWCNKPSQDDTYHQVEAKYGDEPRQTTFYFLCTKCYKAGKANEFK